MYCCFSFRCMLYSTPTFTLLLFAEILAILKVLQHAKHLLSRLYSFLNKSQFLSSSLLHCLLITECHQISSVWNHEFILLYLFKIKKKLFKFYFWYLTQASEEECLLIDYGATRRGAGLPFPRWKNPNCVTLCSMFTLNLWWTPFTTIFIMELISIIMVSLFLLFYVVG